MLGVELRHDRISPKDGLIESIDITGLCSKRNLQRRVRVDYLDTADDLEIVLTDCYPDSEFGDTYHYQLSNLAIEASPARRAFDRQAQRLGADSQTLVQTIASYVPEEYRALTAAK